MNLLFRAEPFIIVLISKSFFVKINVNILNKQTVMKGFSSLLSPCAREPAVGASRYKDKNEIHPGTFFVKSD